MSVGCKFTTCEALGVIEDLTFYYYQVWRLKAT